MGAASRDVPRFVLAGGKANFPCPSETEAGVRQRRKRALHRMTLRQMDDEAGSDGLWGVSTIVAERIQCVRDLALLLTAVGTLDVNEALRRIARWKKLEQMYQIEAELRLEMQERPCCN